MSRRNRDSEGNDNSEVPLFGNWRNAYLTVVAFFVIDVALFYFFSRYFS